MGLSVRRSRRPSALCQPRGESRRDRHAGEQSGRGNHRYAGRPWLRHRRRPRPRLLQQRPREQSEYRRSEDAQDAAEGRHRRESGRDSVRAVEERSVRLQRPRQIGDRDRRAERKSRHDHPAGGQARVGTGRFESGQGVREHRGSERDQGARHRDAQSERHVADRTGRIGVGHVDRSGQSPSLPRLRQQVDADGRRRERQSDLQRTDRGRSRLQLVRSRNETCVRVERRLRYGDDRARGLADSAESRTDAEDDARRPHDGARSGDAYDLSGRHELRAAGAWIEGAAEGGARLVQSARVSDGQRIVIRSSLLGAVVAVAVAAPASAQPPPRDIAPLTLQGALAQARANSQQLRAALTTAQLAAEDRKQARAALLPSLGGFMQYIYTEPNGTPSGVFVANDGPHVYNTWGTVHGDLIAPGKWADYRAAAAAEAVARAKADIATRGLVATVVQNFYTVVATQRKAASAQTSLAEAQQFLDITQRQERGGEVAHSDVVKAQIQVAQRQRDAEDADLTSEKSRIGLAVLVFPGFREDFTVVDDLQEAGPLGSLDGVKAAAAEASPDLRAAQALLSEESFGVSVARSGLLPSVTFDYFYGIDANQFAIYDRDHHRNLGSWAQAQMTIPLWSWGVTQSKLRQAELRVE